MLIQVHEELDALGTAAAELFAQSCAAAVAERSRFSVCLAGGTTPGETYRKLATNPFREQVEWDRVHIFFGDERCVPPDDPRSNYGMARQALLDQVPIPAGQIHPILCDGDDEAGALAYEELIRAFFGGHSPNFDLVLLGMGEDGHTASLFPSTPALSERERWVVPACPPGQELCRVTLTVPLINQARTVAFVVAGQAKAPAVQQVLNGPPDPLRLPSQLIQPSAGELIFQLDRAAASLLVT